VSSRKFDRFMVDVNIGTNRKLRRLTPAERWCHVAGVLAVAAHAPIRGCLLVGDHDPVPRDYAEQAGVTVAVATATLAKLRDLGIVEYDGEQGCERIHDWDDHNPAPRGDPTAAERQRRHREKHQTRYITPSHAAVTARDTVTVTAGREEKRREEKTISAAAVVAQTGGGGEYRMAG
jgi:DNA-binding transcriptional regulator YhcF (GntR family)